MKILQEIRVPQESVNDDFLTVVEIPFEQGDFVEKDDTLIELETSKALLTIESETDGYIQYYCDEEDEVKINSIIVKIFDSKPDEKEIVNADNNNSDEENKVEQKKIVKNHITIFSEKAESYINENKLDKNKFFHLDFVSLADIILKEEKEEVAKVVKTKEVKEIIEKIDESKVKLQDLSKNKKREIEYLKAVQKENLNSIINIFIDTKNIFKRINPHLKYLKNSLLPMIIYETSRLLKKYPEFNSYFVNDKIALYNDVNIGFAVDMEFGLKTVKIPETNLQSIQQIEQQVFDLSNKYIDKKLKVEDLTDITFTITDLSSEDVSFFVPLINKNNSAILGISANDEKLNRTILTLTFDHRVTVGKNAAIFLKELKTRIESYKQISKNEIDTSIKCFRCMKTLEEDHNEVGFLKTITKDGSEKYICQTCFTGF